MKVTITLEFENAITDEATLKEAVYSYLEELMDDDSLDYMVDNKFLKIKEQNNE